jgi:methylation protein EvaC
MPEQFKDEWFYSLQVFFCPECRTVQIGNCPDGAKVVFNENYSFFTGTSKYMIKHFADLASLIKEKYMPANGVIVEIGSNDGTFLEHFKDNIHIGFDPAESVNNVARAKGINVYSCPFDSFDSLTSMCPKTNVFVSTNSFAHIENRHGVLGNIKQMLAQDGIWINEEPYLGNIIDQSAYDQFYNEHIYYTSFASMEKTLNMHDLEIIDYEFIWTHGGSIRYFVGHKKQKPNSKIENAIKNEGLDNYEVFSCFGKAVKDRAKEFKQILKGMEKPLVGYAASAKSTTILNYCKIGSDIISKIYDTTPEKQGKFSPGMHIPIVPYRKFKEDNPKDVVLFAWNHFEEIKVKEAGSERNWIMPINMKRIST